MSLKPNELAKRGIPNFAITRERISSLPLEGFDSHGLYWYKTDSRKMEPLIKQGSYLCLKPIPNTEKIFGLNGEVYLFAIRQKSGKIITLLGNAVSTQNSTTITIQTTSPFPCKNEFSKSQIVEVYAVVYSMTPLPTPYRF